MAAATVGARRADRLWERACRARSPAAPPAFAISPDQQPPPAAADASEAGTETEAWIGVAAATEDDELVVDEGSPRRDDLVRISRQGQRTLGEAPLGLVLMAVDQHGSPLGMEGGRAWRWTRNGAWQVLEVPDPDTPPATPGR